MNFKRNFFSIIFALAGVICLSSCVFDGPKPFRRFDFIETKQDSEKDIIGQGYIKYKNYSSYTIDSSEGPTSLGSSYEILRDYANESHIPSEGNQNILVIPVEFSDYGVDKLGLSKDQYIENLNKVFFGSTENNAYVSVSEYYNRSSYGKLRLSGKVCDQIYTFPLSIESIKEKKLKRDELVKKYYTKVLEWYKENHDDLDSFKIEGLKEGKNVPIYMVYTYPSEELVADDENFFWAYTFSDVPLSWSSSSFMYLNYGEPNAHTYIHETGHLFGLVDYYPDTSKVSDKEVVVPEQTARIDMMDCSIGDHTSFSKMMLNWVKPYYVTDSCEISISSLADSGDLILLANDWNKTVFDEYYLLEFYTPTVLNAYDVSFGNSEAKLPTVPGIKLYHVDARLAYVNSKKRPLKYCEDGEAIPVATNIYFAHDNDTYDEPNNFQKNYLYSLVLNRSTEVKNACATNENLFRNGEVIEDLKFNDGSSLNYKITIESLQFTKTTIKVEKTA